jgi:hypothetical protein
MCRIEKWNSRTLSKKINSMLFERTALSKKPESLVEAEIALLRKEDRISPDLVFRDPYFLEFSWSKTGTEVVDEFEKKLQRIPDLQSKTIEKVLITASGASDALLKCSYFDRIITLEDIFLRSKLGI